MPPTSTPFTLSGAFNILAAPPCSYVVGPLNPTVPAGAGSASVVVTPNPSSCAWDANTATPWITLLPKSPTTQPYSVAANPNTASRDGIITIAGKTVTVTQTGACTYRHQSDEPDLQRKRRYCVPQRAGSGRCSWSAVSNTGWITVTATLLVRASAQ